MIFAHSTTIKRRLGSTLEDQKNFWKKFQKIKMRRQHATLDHR